ARGDSLSSQPQLGPMVHEYEDPSLRERFEHPYRIIYRVMDQDVAIVTVIHSARQLPRKV
ncbi:MAG TPA: type II toxin-antitoxin system RelE/ParE family toxin, partial [Isosphaeraceae bacterium]|nr:type II toxin-antitoxin system RelE/ParE family toxin [Isosphaeraceae bacterium]